MIHPRRDAINFRPLASLPRLSTPVLRADALAGLTVAVFAVPQAMAYAALAGLPPVQGLYVAVVMSVVATLWGSSPYLNTGLTVTSALLTAATLAPFVARGASMLDLVWTFTLLVGAIRILLGLFKTGWIVRFVPEPAFLGFMAAANILIALGQLHQFFGISSPHAPSTLLKLGEVFYNLPQTNPRAVLIGLLVVGVLVLFDKYSKRFPVALASILLATVAAVALGSTRLGAPVQLVRDIAPIPHGLPPLQFGPLRFDLIPSMLPGALAVAAIGLIEAVSIGQSLALKKKSEVNFNQEFFGQGVSQIAGALVGGLPGSASFSRSALIERSGGQTALANIFFGVFTALALWLFPSLLEQIPLAALAGLLFFTGIKMLDVATMRRVWKTSRSDFAVLALTFGVTFFGKIEWGFFAGVVVAMAVFLNRARDLQIFELVPRKVSTHFEESPYKPDSRHEKSDVVALALHGDLFFGLAQELREQLGEIARVQDPKFLVIRTRRARSIDYSCWKALFDFAAAFRENGGVLILTGVHGELREVIEDAGMKNVLPPECIVNPTGSAWQAFEMGLERVAQQLEPDAELSPAWREYFDKLQLKESVSHWRDPFNDPATLGIVEA